MKGIVRQILVAVATVAVIVVNALANILPFNGVTTGQVSDQFDVYFVPAAYVFAIWGVIYLFLVGYTIYQALPAQRDDPRLQRIGYLYILSSIANIAWIFLWHYQVFVPTLLAMFTLLGSLIAIYLTAGVGRERLSPTATWLVQVPFSIYLGWITVATIANVTSVLDFVGWNGWGLSPEAWMIIILIVTAALASATVFTRRDIAYGLVIVWALVGVAVRNASVSIVAIPTALAIVVVVLALALGLRRAYTRTQ
ncbi:MAG: tryptophan-rich sensory protein [Chloroflexi bacterium]|jgi:hypothetical protein|nr:tryptophan-rich sensory protein [Chloroflexota bacterium]